jgi:phosphatidylglycerophosphate synthase
VEQRAETIGQIAILLAPDDKGLQAVFGIPVVRRLTLLALQLGLREIHIIGQVKALQPILSDLVPPERFHPAEEPASLGAVVESLALHDQQKVLVLKANHIIDRGSLTRLIKTGVHSDLYFMEAKGKTSTERLYLATPSYLASILSHLYSPSSHLPLPDQAQPVQGTDGLPYVLDGGEEQVRIAEDNLMKALALQTAESDGFLARHLSRRVSRFMSRSLVRTPVTPNQISLGGASIGIMGAFCFSWGGYWPPFIGSLLFLFCIIVDGVDGEIARLKLRDTPFGRHLDVIMDNIVHIAIFVGIAMGLYRDSGDFADLLMLGVLLGGFGLCAVAVYQCIVRRSPDELRQSTKTLRFMALLSNRDFAYLVVLLALVQRLQWFLIGAAVGTYLFAATLWMISFYEKRAIAR